MKVKEVKVGYRFKCPIRGFGIIIKSTPRTLTAKFEYSTKKITYRYLNSEFLNTDFI